MVSQPGNADFRGRTKRGNQPELIIAHLELKEALHCPATPSLKEESPCGRLGLQNLSVQPVPVSAYTMVSNKTVRERLHSAFLPYYLEKAPIISSNILASCREQTEAQCYASSITAMQ